MRRGKPDGEVSDGNDAAKVRSRSLVVRPEDNSEPVSEASDSEDGSAPDELDEDFKSSLDRLLPSKTNPSERLKMPLEMTTYDSIVLSVVLICDRHYVHTQGFRPAAMQFGCMLILHLFTVASQFLLIYWTYLDTTLEDPFEDAEDKLELVRHAIETKQFLNTTSHPKMKLGEETLKKLRTQTLRKCRRDTAKPACHLLVNAIWVTRMMQELSEAVWRALCLWRLNDVQRKGHLVDWVDGNIHSLPRVLKHTLIASVSVPQMLIAVTLAWTGVKMLEEATSMTDIVLRALTLQYIIGIDELVFMAFSAVRYKHLMSSIQYYISCGNTSTSWQVFGVNTIKILGFWTSLVFIYLSFHHIQQLRIACHYYLDLNPTERGDTHPRTWLFGTLPPWMTPR